MQQIIDRTVAALDEHDPAWPFRIDEEILNIADPRLCIYGQLWGDKSEILARHGDSRAPREAFAPYTAAWRATIRDLKAARADRPVFGCAPPPMDVLASAYGWDLNTGKCDSLAA